MDGPMGYLRTDDNLKAFLGTRSTYSVNDVVHPYDIERLKEALDLLAADGKSMVALRMKRSDGKFRWMLVTIQQDKTKYHSDDLSIEVRDIAELKDTYEILNGKNVRYMEYFSLMECLMVSYDIGTERLRLFMVGSHQQVDFYNGPMSIWHDRQIQNSEADEKSRISFEHLYKDMQKGEVNFEYKLKMQLFEENNHMDLCLIKGKTVQDHRGERYVIATISIINSTGNSLEELSLISGVMDAGTDLLNKKTITSYARRLIETGSDDSVTIAIIDIDNFKEINDRYGHMFGDRVIRNVADILKQAVEGKGVSGRIGGDEMFIVLKNIDKEEEIRSVLRFIKDNVSDMFYNDMGKPTVTCSIGAATYPKDAKEYDELFNISDKVLYLAKERGRNRYIIYDRNLHNDYINGRGMTYDSTQVINRYRKANVINEIMDQFHVEGNKCMKDIGSKIASVFCIDTIYVYTVSGFVCTRTIIYGADTKSDYDGEYLMNQNYLDDFREDGVMVIDNVSYLETKLENAYLAMKQMGIHQSIQVLKKHFDHKNESGAEKTQSQLPNVIVAFNRNRQLKKWSDMDIMYLTIVGNIIGMGIQNDR